MNSWRTAIAIKHLLARRRQTLVSLLGIVLGVAFFLSISSMMQGSENDFLKRLVDNAPHITISDEFRTSRAQPAQTLFHNAVVEILHVKPLTETRGLRGYQQMVQALRTIQGLRTSAVLTGEALVSFAGKDVAIAVNGITPAEYADVSTLSSYMKTGSLADLGANPNGILVGDQFMKTLSLRPGDNINVSATTGEVHTFKIVGVFHTGRANVDQSETFVAIKRVQALLNRANRANSIVIKLDDANRARDLADQIEQRFAYKSVSWQEASEDIMNALMLRKVIMYTVVSAVLVVAAFGIYNVISTVAMEKQRDIAILKSIGFHATDIERIFLVQGAILGLLGSAIGLPFGGLIMAGLMNIQFKFPGSTDVQHMVMDWSWYQFAMASAFAFVSAVFAALLPARKAARVKPVDILRGSF